MRYFGPNAVAFKTESGRLAAEFANRLHADMGAMADAVRTSTSNIAASLGGAPIAIRLDPRPIAPPTPQSVDFVDVDTAALESLLPAISEPLRVAPPGPRRPTSAGCRRPTGRATPSSPRSTPSAASPPPPGHQVRRRRAVDRRLRPQPARSPSSPPTADRNAPSTVLARGMVSSHAASSRPEVTSGRRLDKRPVDHVANCPNGETPGRRGVPREGQDDLEVPRQRVRRARLGGPRGRPAEQGPEHRRRQRLQADLRAHRARQAGREGPQGRAEGRLRAVPRDRRGPRGRGDLVAPARVPQAQGAREADGVPRDHPGRDRPRRQQPTLDRLRPGRRRRDAPHPRPAVRLRGVAGAVAARQPRPVRRARAEPGGPPDRRARARADRVRRRRLLGHRPAHGHRAGVQRRRSSPSTAPRSPPARTSTSRRPRQRARRSPSTRRAPGARRRARRARRSRCAPSRRSRTSRRRSRRS